MSAPPLGTPHTYKLKQRELCYSNIYIYIYIAAARSCENWNKVGRVIHGAQFSSSISLLLLYGELQIVVWQWHTIAMHFATLRQRTQRRQTVLIGLP